eukprot:m.296829 g.296829  ORF g.296829 m.296829 type:complete len:94 (-) comp19523_c0_seq5:51-332(-)
MQFTVSPNVCYLDIPGMVRKQRQQLQALISQKEDAATKHEGLRCFAEGRTFVNICDIPGVLESGWKVEGTSVLASPTPGVLFILLFIGLLDFV